MIDQTIKAMNIADMHAEELQQVARIAHKALGWSMIPPEDMIGAFEIPHRRREGKSMNKPSRYLHIICARCGAYNDMIDYTIDIPTIESGELPSVTYHCHNCGTLDDLSNAIEERQEEGQ